MAATLMNPWALLSVPSPQYFTRGTVMILITPMAIMAATERLVLICARSSIFCVIAPHSVPYGRLTHVYPNTNRP